MSTVLEQQEVVEHEGTPGQSAMQRYRESVFSGQCDEAVLFAARRIKPEWLEDRRVFLARVKACESLKTEVPRLEEAARQAAEALKEAEAFAAGILDDGTTVGNLRERVRKANPEVPAGTPQELAAALQWLTGNVHDLGMKLFSAQTAIPAAKNRAGVILSQTAAKQDPDPELACLAGRTEELRARIAGRQKILQAEGKAKLAELECRQLARGERPADLTGGLKQLEPLPTLYKRARARLDQLLDLASKKPDAEKANAADQAELAGLQEKISAAQARRLERLCDPRAMKWSGTE